MKNYDFYNKATWQEVKPNIKVFIELFQKQSDPKIQNIQQFYENLEYDHSFIQWMFPNFYSSRYNSNSYKLTLQERYKMINTDIILKRYYQNYILILRFFGIQLKQMIIKNDDINKNNYQFNENNQQFNDSDMQSQFQIINKQINIKEQINNEQNEKQQLKQNNQGYNQLKQLQQQFQLSNNQNNNYILNDTLQMKQTNNNNQQSELVLIDKYQFELCCLKNTHNLLRLQRILASLSVLKHRKEAIQLCQFLKKELINLGKVKIYEEYFSGFDRYYEELSENEMNKDYIRNFNSYKYYYVDKDLIEKVDISIIQ